MDLVKLIIEAEAPPALVSEDLGELKKLPPLAQKFVLDRIKHDIQFGENCAVWPLGATDVGGLNKAINKIMDDMAEAGVVNDKDFCVYAVVVLGDGTNYVIRKYGRADRRYTVWAYDPKTMGGWDKSNNWSDAGGGVRGWHTVSDKKGNTLDSVYQFSGFDRTSKVWVIGPDTKRIALRSQRWKDKEVNDPLAKRGSYTASQASTVDKAAARALIANKLAETHAKLIPIINGWIADVNKGDRVSNYDLRSRFEMLGKMPRVYFADTSGDRSNIDEVKSTLKAIKELDAWISKLK